MSIYYECRFKNVVIETTGQDDVTFDIRNWLQKVINGSHEDVVWEYFTKLPDYEKMSRMENLSNTFTDNLKKSIRFDSKLITIDLCVGNKNKDEDIERFIALIHPYIKSGDIYFYNEDITRKVKLFNLTDEEKQELYDEYILTYEVLDIKDKVKDSLSIDDLIYRGEIEDVLYDELHKGLI